VLADALGGIRGSDDVPPGVGADDHVGDVECDGDCGGGPVCGLHLGEDVLDELENPGQLLRK
jgi:hypothetical protein